ncbi:MAG: molybdopterin converting factor subunit 1 [Betaproteobacteria bacterium]|nr:molybdopterin converting factor subunit 1 [Betaproteobacteria bacterium]
MRLRLVYFAALREHLGRDGESLTVPAEVRTLADLRHTLASRDSRWQEALGPHRLVRAAIDQRLASDDEMLSDGVEVAFFPPVTGG